MYKPSALGQAFASLCLSDALGLSRDAGQRRSSPRWVSDKRLWRIIHHYVSNAIAALNLESLKAIGLDETVSKRSHY